MNTIHDYESFIFLDFQARRPELLETYEGKSIVRWHGKIEGQLKNLLDDAEKGRNFPYADKLREFLKIWRGNEITGSINREVLDTLKAASDMLAVDSWDLSSYFRSLRDELRVLIASEEQLPRDVDMNQNDPMAGGGGHGGGGPPMSPDFGPEDGAPGGEGGEGGMPGGGGAPMGGPGGEPMNPDAEADLANQPGGMPEEGEPVPGEEEAPGQEPGAPDPEDTSSGMPGVDDMPEKERFGQL